MQHKSENVKLSENIPEKRKKSPLSPSPGLLFLALLCVFAVKKRESSG